MIGWIVAKPTSVWIDGEFAVSDADPSQVTTTESTGLIARQLGLQTVLIEAMESGAQAQTARLEYLLRVVKEHPSGLDWSEIRPDDYPE